MAVIVIRNAATAATPSAFYTPPDPLPAGEPGTIIRSEPLTDNVPEGAAAWRVMYLSTDENGEPIAVTGSVIAPAGESTEPRPVIAWTHGTAGIFPECGLSHTANPFQAAPDVPLMVEQGFVVTLTDYPGLSTPGVHPYMVGPVAAHAALDSVRAAQQLEVDAGDRVVVWGASQGGNSSLWTAQLAETYAPELTLLGAAASAPAIDLATLWGTFLDSQFGGVLMGYILYAWDNHYPDANLDEIIKPEQRETFERMVHLCLTTPAAFFTLGSDNILTPNEYLISSPLETEPWRTILEENAPRGAIEVPILITHGTADSLIPFTESEAEAERRCAAGEDVQFARYPGVSHDSSRESAVMVIGWIEDRFAGRPTGSNCGE